MNFPVLSLTLILPLIGILLILLLPERREKEIKFVSLLITFGVFLLALLALASFDYQNPNMQFVERYPWIKSAGIDYHLGIDGISLPLFSLAAFLSLLVVIFSWEIKYRLKAYFGLLLLLEIGMLGIFVALDFILFYIFWEWVLVPMYFLITIWGGTRRSYAGLKFLLYTLFGSVIMLIGILGLHFASKLNTFNILEITKCKFPLNLQALFFVALFIGFAFKVPLFPFHTWLPDAYVEAPTGASVLLAGVLAKMGAYGFIRISLPILPDAFRMFATPLAILGVANIVYGAFVAMAQKDLKRLIAYSSLSHMGYIILGTATGTLSGLNGAVLGMFNHGTIIGILFLLVGLIYQRTQTREIKDLEGLSLRVPILSGILTFATLSAIGLPGLSAFVNEFLVLLGIFQSIWLRKIFIIFVIPGMILTMIYFLRLLIRVNLFKPATKGYANLKDLQPRELMVLVPLMIIILFFGLYPALILNYINPPVTHLLQNILSSFTKILR